MLNLDTFHTRYVHRENTSLASPRIMDAFEIHLPINSVIHYVSDTQADIGIRGSHPLLQHTSGTARLAFVSDGYGTYGNYTKIATNTSSLIKNYRAAQKGIDYFGTATKAMARENELAVLDYSLLTRMFRYRQTVTRLYDEWRNIITAIVAQINAKGNIRNNFIYIQLPQSLPEESVLKNTTDKLANTYLEDISNNGAFWMRELYNYMLGKEEVLKLENPEKTFFVISEGRSSVVLPAKQIKDRGESQITKLYDMFEKLLEQRPGADNDALAEESTEGTTPKKDTLVDGVPDTMTRRVVALNDAGKLTPSQARAMINVAQRTPNLESPFSGQSFEQASRVTEEKKRVKEELATPVNDLVVQPHMKRATTNSLYADYINSGLYEADMINVMQHFRRSGLLIQDVKSKDKIDALNDASTLTLKLLPINGKASTANIDLFNLNPDGSFKADGVSYAMDAQKVDMPIRKTHPHRAALTSYFGKLFIQRSQLAAHNYTNWVTKKLSDAGLNSDDNRVQKIRFGENAIPKTPLPRAYTAVMREISEFSHPAGARFYFEYKDANKIFGEANVKKYNKNGNVLVAKKGDDLFYMKPDDTIWQVGKKDIPHGDFMELMGGKQGWGKRPKEFTELANLKGKRVPIGVLLGYYLGFGKMIRKLGVKYRYEPANVRSTAKDDEFSLTFNDQRFHFTFPTKEAEYIVTGYTVIADILKGYKAGDLNQKETFFPILSALGCKKYHMTELDLIEELFVDPITEEILQDMKEPTDIIDLFIRCSELVASDEHPDETDPEFMRERRLERIPGFLYSTMVKAVREQRNKPNPSIHPVYIGPRDVWSAVLEDSTTQLVKELNPVHTLKQLESVSLSGEGGRAAETLVKSSRVFHEKDVGRYSMDTPDSGKVGIRTFAPPNARVKNLRGVHGDYDFERDGATAVLSTTGLILPAMHHDDGKRQNLGSVQQSAVTPAIGYDLAPCRTGYESIVGSRLGDLYVKTAKKSGKVTEVSDKFLSVEYDDGTKQGWNIGVYHGKAEGKTIPHYYDTDMQVGDKVKEGDILAWNTGFFVRDIFAPRNVVMKTGAMFRTVLMENNDTLEDGSRIGSRVRKKLSTWTSKEKGILVRADQVVQDLVKVGDELMDDDILCRIFEAGTENIASTDASLAVLNRLTGSNPQAGKQGKVGRIEVIYNGEIEDFDPSLQTIIKADNSRRAKEARQLGGRIAKTGQISRPTFFAGEKVIPGTMVIAVYIDSLLDFNPGDKFAVANQLKSVPGGTLDGVNETLDGKEIDVIFGYRSVNDRIVGSPIKQGSINTTMIYVTDDVMDILINGPKK